MFSIEFKGCSGARLLLSGEDGRYWERMTRQVADSPVVIGDKLIMPE